MGRTTKAMCKVLQTLVCVEEIEVERMFLTRTNELVRGCGVNRTMIEEWSEKGGVLEK